MTLEPNPNPIATISLQIASPSARRRPKMRTSKPITFLPPSACDNSTQAFLECQRAIADYCASSKALFLARQRRNYPDIPLTLIHKAAAAGMTLDRLCSALPVKRATIIAAVKRAEAILDGRSQLIHPDPDPARGPTPPTPDVAAIFETLIKDDTMSPVPSTEPVKSRRTRRKSNEVQRLIQTAIEKCLAETGLHPSRTSIAKITGISLATVARRWPQHHGVAPQTEEGSKETPVTPITSSGSIKGLNADDEAAIELVTQRNYGYALVPGMVPLGDETYRCDIMKKNEAGELVAHCEAWRLQLPQVRKIVQAFQELRG